jgi:outer membrane protein TolC
MGASLTQPLFHGGALKAKRNAAQAEFEASSDNYRQTVLTAFQNVADTLSALTQDAETFAAARRVREHDEQLWRDAEYRATLGAVAPFTVRSSEKQYQNARLAEIRALSARLVDTAGLFQAMGESAKEAQGEGDKLTSR